MNAERFDAVVIGAGMAGLPLALKLGSEGWKVALVERAEVGGTCLNRGCIPSKTIIASANVAHQARSAARWGIAVDAVRTDMAAVVARKDGLVHGIRTGAERNLTSAPNVTLIRGHARLTGVGALDVEGRSVTTGRVFINTGARPQLPAIAGLDGVPYLDSTSVMELQHLPEHLIVVGGGYVGVELGQAFHRFGSRVTLLQSASHLLPEEDHDISDALLQVLRNDGLGVAVGARVERVEATAAGIAVTARGDRGEQRHEGSHLLIATGRTPNTDDLGLAGIGVGLGEGGFVRVNDRLETNVTGVWALGDARGGAMFTHTARDDARIVFDNLIRRSDIGTRDRTIPYAVFTEPQLGRVGLTERRARALGLDVEVGTFPAKRIARARAIDETEGIVKVVVDAAADRLLGVSALVANGGEIAQALTIAIAERVPFTKLRDVLFTHPTISEGLSSALGGVHAEEGL